MATHDESVMTNGLRRIRIPQWIGEILLVVALYVAYEFARGLHQGTDATADKTGLRLLHWEQVVHLDPEKWLTVHLDHITWLAVIAAYLYSTMHYIITPIVLIWLYRMHHSVYGPARTWLGLSTLVALVMFYYLPTTPPRLLDRGYPDVLADVDRYGWWSNKGSAPQGLGHLTNQLAAMPSMHVGWALWCGFMVWRYASRRWVQWLGAAYPATTTIIVLSTGNHYLLDAVAGALVMAAGALVSLAITRGRRSWRTHRRHSRVTAANHGRSLTDGGRDQERVQRIDTPIGEHGSAHGDRESANSGT